MYVENLFEKFKLEEGVDLEAAAGCHRGLLGNSFSINVGSFQVDTFQKRVELIDKATEIEHQRLMDDEDSWAITGLIKIGENWKEFDFEYGQEMLFNAIRYDLAYSRSERLPIGIAQKFYELIISDYKKENAFIYCNYDKSPWDKESGGYGGWNLTDDWTFDLGIVLIDPNKLTFSYFLSED